MKNRKGFTMVELLGAVVILGILMMVAIPSVSSLIQNSKNKYYISQKKNLESAAKSYYSNNKIILRNEGDFVDVSLEELVKKKYISKMVDGTKADCVMSKPVGNEASQEYTFVRIKKEKNRVVYISHLYCPAYQDKNVGAGGANITHTISNDGRSVIINLEHQDEGRIIKSYTYQLYLGENNLVKRTLSNNSKTVRTSYDVSRFITAAENTIRVYIYAVDDKGNTFSTWGSTIVIDDRSPRCIVENVEVLKDYGDKFKVSYSFICRSENGCESTNNKGTLISTKEGTATNPYVTEQVAIKDRLTGNTGACDIEFDGRHRFTLTYDDNGGSGCSNKPVTRFKNEKWNSSCIPTRPGHIFDDWKVDSETVTNETLSDTAAVKNTVAVANWIPGQRIVYMRNTTSTDTVSKTEVKPGGTPYSIASNTWTNTGKVFLGWATVKSATATSGTWYDPAQSYETEADLTLYAQWYNVKSLEETYTTYVQSGDLIHHVSKKYNNINVDIGNYYNWPNTFHDNSNVIGISGVQAANVRPYKHEPTLIRVRAQYDTSQADGFQNYLTHEKRSSTSYTDSIDKRIDRLQKMDDVVLTYDDFKIKRCTFDNKAYSYNTDNRAVVACSPDGGYSIISAAGVKAENASSNGKHISRSYIIQMSKGNDIGNTYGCSGSSNGCVRVAVTKNNTDVKLKIQSDFLEVKNKTARKTTFAPTSEKGLARYKALVALSNNGHGSNCFPASYIKTAKVTMDKCETLNSWGDDCTKSKSISIPNGAILGVVGWDISNNPNNGSGESFGLPVVATLNSVSTGLSNTAVSQYYVGNSCYNDGNVNTMKNVRMNLHVRYVSSGKLKQ